ncbi:MAG: ferrochelatase [Burkholderiales bacterium]
MGAATDTGILLVNLGTPEAPTAAAVREYLAEFLGDRRVVKIPRIIWLPILYGFILRTRPAQSAEKYRSVWTDEGSPLKVHTVRQAKLLRGLLGPGGARVEYAMRYGKPRIADAIAALREAGCTRIVALPLYPQFSESTTESVRDVLDAGVRMIEDFHAHPAYIGALAAVVRRYWEYHERGEKLVMSFHGLPQKVVDAGDPYQKQCLETARLLAARLDLDADRYLVTFQSRFGRAQWLQPYTEPTLVKLARSGLREVDVFCPGFVSDCLETLEELGIGAREAFLGAGGRMFRLIPCLNESDDWIRAMRSIVEGRAD